MKFKNFNQAQKLTGLSYLGNINSSAKIVKNQKISQQYTYILYLSPTNKSGYNVCSHATDECRIGCLASSGRAGIGQDNSIQKSRITKTKLFFEHRNFFMDWLVAEIKYFYQKAKDEGFGFSVRLNGTSDIDWQSVVLKPHNCNLFDLFSDIQFYDYTKNPSKFINKAKNYHLTFSYTGYNWSTCEKLLELGHNVAVVFDLKKKTEMIKDFNNYPVIDGDITDYRPNDPKSTIVGLRWKRIQNKQDNQTIKNSIFVVK